MADAPLDPDALGARLAEIYTVVGPVYRRALRVVERDAPVEGLSVGVRAVLDLLHRHGAMTVPQMGRAQALSRQFVQRMVNSAASSGLVELIDNPQHRRSSLVRLTGAGEDAITALTQREHAALRHVGGELTAVEVDACLKVLTEMLRALDDVEFE
jgi:DNA-binding MarR family transcriptional regulator